MFFKLVSEYPLKPGISRSSWSLMALIAPEPYSKLRVFLDNFYLIYACKSLFFLVEILKIQTYARKNEEI